MSKIQEELFTEIQQIKKSYELQNIASYVQNDITWAIENNGMSIEQIKQMQTDQSKEFDEIIESLTVLKKRCF